SDIRVWRAFIAADTDRSGLIDRSELQTALVNSPWNKRSYQVATAKRGAKPLIVVSRAQLIDNIQFLGLSKYVKEWRDEFEKADRDRSGTIDAEELRKALKRFGYRLPLQTVKMLHRKHGSYLDWIPHGRDDGITFDQFMRACIAVQDLGKTFEQFNGPRDLQHRSNFENFVLSAVST
ncbi:EF-hand, partial [Coprinellus micaceus]